MQYLISPFLLSTLICCGDSKDSGDDFDSGSQNTVSFITYMDADCTELPQMDSVVNLDTTISCNKTPDSSISRLICFEDRISYTNHPNTSDCSADGIENELPVGVCEEFPGPVRTWKLIESSTYNCISE
jgi:hypothetical protein